MTETIEETTEFPEDMRLFKFGILAGTFGWLVLIIGLVQTAMNFAQYISMGKFIFNGMTPLNLFTFILSNILPLISSIVMWFILRVVKELLLVMIDIKEYVKENDAG